MTTAADDHNPKTRLYGAGSSRIRASVAVGWARAALGAWAALLLGSVVDIAIQGGVATTQIAWLAILLLTRAGVATLAPLLATTTATRVESDLRHRLIDAVLRVGPWSGRRTGETVTRATEGVEAVGALAGSFLPQLIAGMSIPILLAIAVAVIDWVIALVLIVVIPLIPALLRLLEKRFASVSTRYREAADQLASRFLDGIQGLRTLKALDRAEAYGDEIAEEAERLRTETMSLLRVNQLALLAVDTLFTVGTVVAAAVMAALRLSAGVISAGEALAIVLLGVMLIEPLSQIGRFFYVGAIGRAAAAQVKDLLEIAEVDTLTKARIDVDRGRIFFDGVGFRYPDGTEAIKGCSLEVLPGERVALVGPSGAGKTTIAHLTVGLLEPQEGMIGVGGPAVLVPQRPYLFRGTVAENLRLAKPEASDAELWEALAAANLDETLRGRSAGLETPVGERGLDLSGGEVQRLAIARAFLTDSPVVVLDEPTSNVDLESEARIRSAIARLTRGRTLMVIAHRRSTIAGVDRVLVVQRGRVRASLDGTDALTQLIDTKESAT
ncbi:MAG TPA: ABC transporter transmembrane domain-containing protein [Acidimicrobiia bacterium]|nr:ABC transporter transmembrane domain-containing protein [Acidimicrobiia bacterium]